MTIMSVFALVSGFVLWIYFGIAGGWLHAKLTVVLGLVVYHIMSRSMMKQMVAGTLNKSSTFLRIFNEVPLILLILILILAIVKPF